MKNNDETQLYCSYCKEKILEEDSFIQDPNTGKYYHYSEDSIYDNCYFPDDLDDGDDCEE